MLEIYGKIENRVIGRETETKSILVGMETGKHVLLEGPPGTSKSTLVRSIARECRIPLYVVEGSVDLTPAKLVGHHDPAKVMSDTYHPEHFVKGPLTRAMEEGGILYIEEFNRMPADVSNVLISPLEEGEMHVPRYGTVKASPGFTVFAAQNPYDDAGTVRVSRALLDRVCVVKLDYQSEEEEREIVRSLCAVEDTGLIAFAVAMVRETRTRPDVKLGASVRAAIDMVELFTKLQDQEDRLNHHLWVAARMALSNKIWLAETAQKTPDDIIGEIWHQLKDRYRLVFGDVHNGAIWLRQDAAQESTNGVRDDEDARPHWPDSFRPGPDESHPFDFESNDPREYWQMARFLNRHPEQMETFFEQPGSLEAYARMLTRLQDDVAALATKIASRLIIKVARSIADTGYRSGRLTLIRGFREGAEIELDRSLERHAEEPEREIWDSLVSYVRHREKRAFVMMLDYSYSMQSKIILAAITAASIAQHFKRDYAILGFSSGVSILKHVEDPSGPEQVLEKLFGLQSHGETNIRLALEAGLRCIRKFERKTGLLLTDGNWNKGGDPGQAAAQFDKLSVIGFPPAKHENVRRLALRGSGAFSFVKDQTEIASAIARCLQ